MAPAVCSQCMRLFTISPAGIDGPNAAFDYGPTSVAEHAEHERTLRALGRIVPLQCEAYFSRGVLDLWISLEELSLCRLKPLCAFGLLRSLPRLLGENMKFQRQQVSSQSPALAALSTPACAAAAAASEPAVLTLSCPSLPASAGASRVRPSLGAGRAAKSGSCGSSGRWQHRAARPRQSGCELLCVACWQHRQRLGERRHATGLRETGGEW